VPLPLSRKYFAPGIGTQRGLARVVPAVRELVEFRWMNLVQPSLPIKMSAEILEDLLGTIKGAGTARRREVVCPGCGMTPQDFKQKGRLGCPRCYEAFRQELVPLLQRVHEAVVHRGRLPGGRAPAPPPPGPMAMPASDTERLADLRRRLEDAIRGERYEEAARLRDDLRRAEKGEALS